MTQIPLFDAPPTGLTCAFGTPWPHQTCDGCRNEATRLQAAFQAGFEAGEWDDRGYRPNDRHRASRAAA